MRMNAISKPGGLFVISENWKQPKYPSTED